MTLEHMLDVARTTVQAAKYCILITEGEARLNARVLQPFDPQPDWTIWFGTHPQSRKITDLRRTATATAIYYDRDNLGYVALQGAGQIVDDPALRQRYWNANWRIYFPKGPDEGYAVIKFTPDRLEMMSFGHDITPEPYGLKSVALTRTNDTWQFE